MNQPVISALAPNRTLTGVGFSLYCFLPFVSDSWFSFIRLHCRKTEGWAYKSHLFFSNVLIWESVNWKSLFCENDSNNTKLVHLEMSIHCVLQLVIFVHLVTHFLSLQPIFWLLNILASCRTDCVRWVGPRCWAPVAIDSPAASVCILTLLC